MLERKAAIVTGASNGIGRAAALMLASLGAGIIVNFLSDEAAADDVARAATIPSAGESSTFPRAPQYRSRACLWIIASQKAE